MDLRLHVCQALLTSYACSLQAAHQGGRRHKQPNAAPFLSSVHSAQPGYSAGILLTRLDYCWWWCPQMPSVHLYNVLWERDARAPAGAALITAASSAASSAAAAAATSARIWQRRRRPAGAEVHASQQAGGEQHCTSRAIWKAWINGQSSRSCMMWATCTHPWAAVPLGREHHSTHVHTIRIHIHIHIVPYYT